jgi:hypothetical protein
MNYEVLEAIELLERTPRILEAYLTGLSECWLSVHEGEGTWNAIEVVEHLIALEEENWIPRLEFLLREGESRPFPSFPLHSRVNDSLEQKLQAFKRIREQNIAKLKAHLEAGLNLESTGLHPRFGAVKARELLSTWVVHDLTHLSQIVRVMAGRYRTDVGPWIEFLSVLKKS